MCTDETKRVAMTDTSNIPNTYLNKAQIAVKYSISRVTVDRYLKRLESEGRVFPTKVQQGKRILYNYDPNDIDFHIMPLLQKNKKQVTVQKNVSNITNVQTQSQIELLRVNLQNAEKRLLEKDELIADMKDQREKNYQTIQFLQTQITDQRSNVASTAPEPPEVAVVLPIMEPELPKIATIAEIKEALVDAGSIAVAPKEVSFVKDPVVANVTPSSFIDPNTEVGRDEDLDVTMSRLKYKIDRGEYNFTEAVYAQQISILIDERNALKN